MQAVLHWAAALLQEADPVAPLAVLPQQRIGIAVLGVLQPDERRPVFIQPREEIELVFALEVAADLKSARPARLPGEVHESTRARGQRDDLVADGDLQLLEG